MISPRLSWVIPAALLLASLCNQVFAGPKATAEQIESQTVVDKSGRPVRTGEFALPNYSTPPSSIGGQESLSSGSVPKAATVNATATAPSGHGATTSFASLGECLGCTGLPLFHNQGRVEFFSSTTGMQLPNSPYPGTPNDFWYALTYNATTSSFNQVFVSERAPGGIAELILLPAAREQDRQLAVCGIDGSIRFYSAATKVLLSSETLQFSIQNVFRCAIGDFAHSGHSQYLLASRNQAKVFDHAGNVLWTLPAPAFQYNDILVGQMDQDPALEIAVAEYTASWTPGASPVTIFDGATHAVQLTLSSSVLPFAQNLALAHVGAAGTPALVVSEGWGAVDAFDTLRGTHLWKAPTPINIESLLVTRVPGRTGDQVLIGDGQWGSVHVVDATTGVEHLTIANSEWGVTQMAVGDIGSHGASEFLWGGDAGSSGPQRFVVADPATQKVTAKSRDLDTYFTTPAIGHLLGDTSRQVVFASRTTDNTYDPGSLVVVDASSGRVIAIQDVPLFQGWGSDFAVRVSDVDGDGIDEILVADTHLYDGVVDVYGLTSDHKFTLKSTTYAGYGSPAAYPGFTALAIGNGDRKSSRYAVVGFTESNVSRGPTVPTVIGLDLSTGAEKWRVPLPGVPTSLYGTFYGPSPNAIEALGRDSSGAELFAVLRSEPTFFLPSGQFGEIDIVRVSGATGSVLASYQGLSTSMGVLSAHDHELIVGTSDGMAIVLQLKGTTLIALSRRSVATASVDAIRAGSNGEVWIVSAQRVECVSTKGQVLWKSTDNGYTTPAGLEIDASNEDQARLWVSSVWRVDSYQVGDFDRD